MLALTCRVMGITEDENLIGIKFAGNGAKDTAEAKESYEAGFDLFNGVPLPTTMAKRGRKMQPPNGWSRKEWPSWETTDKGLKCVREAELEKLLTKP